MKWNNLIVGGIVLSLAACGTNKTIITNQNQERPFAIDGKLWASLYQQKAAEYNALCFQAYNIAHLQLDKAIASKGVKPLAIVTDIDETVLDNSPYAVNRSLQGKDYELPSWKEWTSKGSADTLAGALPFFQYAKSQGVEVFYVTNRFEDELEGTLNNLKAFDFPYADSEHLILRKAESSKDARRKAIGEKYDIVLLIGDNLSDFDTDFDKNSAEKRATHVRDKASQFGKKYIVLPNVTYGDWEGALYDYKYNLSESERNSVIKNILKSKY